MTANDREREPRIDPPWDVPMTPILMATQTLACVNHQCVVAIHAGDPVVLLRDGWSHALHLEES